MKRPHQLPDGTLLDLDEVAVVDSQTVQLDAGRSRAFGIVMRSGYKIFVKEVDHDSGRTALNELRDELVELLKKV